MGVAKPYLVLFNLVSCAGWAYLLFGVARSVAAGESPAATWTELGPVLQYVQTLAVMEIVHSVLGLVSAPFFSTFVQVFSRIGILWAFTSQSSAAQHHWSLQLLIASWALVEVPRYAFYAANLVLAKVPLPLFWLRYSLFAVLYPTGITAEIMQIVKTLPLAKHCAARLPALLGGGAACPLWWYLGLLGLSFYVPGAPFMYLHMLAQRTRAFRNRSAPKAAAPSGLVFPAGKKNDRSTTEAGKEALAAALGAIDPKAAEAVRKERNFRFNYNKHIVRLVELGAKNPANALVSAQAGLDWMHNNFEFIRDGKSMSFATAMRDIKGSFETGFVKGTKARPAKHELAIPYGDTVLRGAAIRAQAEKWARDGIIEPDTAAALSTVAEHPDWLDLSDQYFVLLGAGSAMGPLLTLLELGANVIAIDLNRPQIWERLIGLARNSCGTMTFPLAAKQATLANDQALFAAAGCNLFTHAPEVANWLETVQPGAPLNVGMYAYLDGALHVQVALAADAVMQRLCATRPGKITLAFLCTPTDAHLIPKDALDAAKKNLNNAPLWQKLFRMAGLLKPNVAPSVYTGTGKQQAYCDALVVAQGPNYGLAKRLQHWRAMVARNAGCTVSSNVAPSTATVSVVSNKQFAAAYGGFHHFHTEVFYQKTSNAVMCALLVNDIRNDKSPAKPTFPLDNPLQLFQHNSFHGGVWRSPYTIESFGPVAALTTYLKQYSPVLVGLVAALGGLVAVFKTKGYPHKW